MSVIKKVVKNVDGTWNASWVLTEEQMAYLLTFAINKLVIDGILDVDVQEVQNPPRQLEFPYFAYHENGMQ